jgi:hypothetical protein
LLSAKENHNNRIFIEAYFDRTIYAYTTINVVPINQNRFFPGAYCMTLEEQVTSHIGGIFYTIEDSIKDEEVAFFSLKKFLENFQSTS